MQLITMPTISFALAMTQLQVPFDNVEVTSVEPVTAYYHFDPVHQTIECHTSYDYSMASVKWSFNGVTQQALLPVTLKGSSFFPGQYADTDGKLIFYDEGGGYHDYPFVTCQLTNR